MKSTILFFIITSFCLTAFAQQTPKTDDALLLDYYQTQRFAEAAVYLKKTYPEPVYDIKVLAKLAYTSQMAGKLIDAENYYQRIYDIDSTNTAVLFNLGSINLRRGNNLKAEIYYQKIVQKDTTNFNIYKQLAKISLDKGELPAMLNYLQKANRLNPAEPDVAADLSDMYLNFKQYTQAEKVLNQAIIEDPENAVLLQSLLKLDCSQNKWEAAKNTCFKLMQLGDHSGYVLTKLGTAYYNLKDYECSAATLANINELEQGETSYYMAGLAYKALKDQPMAIENLKKAIDAGVSPNIATYYGEIADSYDALKKYKKAMQAYQKALQFNDNSTLYYLLANLYDSKLKNRKNAVIYYKKYIASNPSPKKQTYIAYAKSRIDQLKN
jgi:tetratricopeptide (TPR) repeat protein